MSIWIAVTSIQINSSVAHVGTELYRHTIYGFNAKYPVFKLIFFSKRNVLSKELMIACWVDVLLFFNIVVMSKWQCVTHPQINAW